MPSRHIVRLLLLAALTLTARPSPSFAASTQASPPAAQPASITLYPTDPTGDISWSAGTGGVADIQTAFNNARATENSQLGTTIPMLSLPSQGEWDAMADGERALWLINRERIDRSVMPLHDVEDNVTGVAQTYADYLLDNDAWGHYEDGRSPWQRLHDNPAIGACHDTLNVAENIAVFVTSGGSIALPVERSVFMWIYDDGSCCNWGHRHAVLWYPYNDNGGPVGREGFLGIGRANGGPYQGPFSDPWPYAEMIVMNVFDPCESWAYPSTEIEITSITPESAMLGTTVRITDLAGRNFSPGATVALTRTGYIDIGATNVSVVSTSQITCDLDLDTATTGQWSVTVSNPGGDTDTYLNGFTVAPPVPTLAPIPSQLLLVDETREDAIDLRDYAADPYYDVGQLTFAISNSPDPNAGVSLDAGDRIDITPVPGWEGRTEVEITVTNPAAQSDAGTFTIVVAGVIYAVALPLVLRGGP